MRSPERVMFPVGFAPFGHRTRRFCECFECHHCFYIEVPAKVAQQVGSGDTSGGGVDLRCPQCGENGVYVYDSTPD